MFASELKALRAHPAFDGEIDHRAVRSFLARTYIPAPLSIYRRIFKLLPGMILRVNGGVPEPAEEAPPLGACGSVEVIRYWNHEEVVRNGLSDPFATESDASKALEQALSDAIRDQSVADVPVGAFLSGGIDSSTVVALYQAVNRRPVNTYTIGFAESGFDESADAAAVARHLGTDHHEHHVTSREAREVIPLLPSMYDEPFADSSQIPTYLVSRFARRDVTVALTGDGGDELFGGYNRHVLAPRMWRAASSVPLPMRQIAGPLLGRLPSGVLGAAAAMAGGSDAAQRGAKLRKAFIVGGRARSLHDVYRAYLDEWEGERSPVLGEGGEPESHRWLSDVPDVAAMTHCDAVGYLPDDILCKVDRASMAVSLETRVPFLDHRVAAVAARVPVGMKVSGHRGKMIVRKLLERYVPASLFERPKAGFAVPVGQWIRSDLREWAEQLLDPVAMRQQGLLDPAIVQRRWRDHLSGRRESTPAIWAVLMFQAWLEQNRGD